MAAVAAIKKNPLFTSSPEPKGQLTLNQVGSIAVTCRLKTAKIVPVRNPSGHLENQFFASASESKGQLTWSCQFLAKECAQYWLTA